MNDRDFDRLQRFFDGDLPAKEAEEVRGHIAADPEWGLAHEALGGIRAGLRERAEIAADSADFGVLWRRIDAALGAEPAGAPVGPDAPSLGERFRAWWAAHWTPVVVSAAAAALVAVLVTRALMPAGPSPARAPGKAPPPGPAIAHQQPAPAPPSPAPPPEGSAGSPEAVAKNAPEKNVVVDAVRNEGNKTVLINMPMAADGATVIWLLDDEQTEQDSVTGEDPI